MSRFQLEEIVLLEMSFELSTEPPEENDLSSLGDLLKLGLTVTQSDGEYVLIAHGHLDDPRLGFKMDFIVGARYEAPEGVADGASSEFLESTLTFMAFPYLRELVASTTARSPIGPYHLPPRAPKPKP